MLKNVMSFPYCKFVLETTLSHYVQGLPKNIQEILSDTDGYECGISTSLKVDITLVKTANPILQPNPLSKLLFCYHVFCS